MGRGRGIGRRLGGTLAAVVAAATVAGCTTDPSPDRPRAPAAPSLDASVAQFRFDEGTRRLKAGVTNNGAAAVNVTRATIDWAAMTFPTVDLPAEPVLPGQTAAFTISYGTPSCARAPTTRPALEAVVDGRDRRLPLRVEDPGLLLRLHAKACAEQRLERTAAVTLELAPRPEVVDGSEYLPGDLVLRRRGATGERVRVVDLGGSVLVDVVPRGGRRALPGELAPGAALLRFPLLFGSTHRCDAHAVSQSSQTFLLSAYLRVGERPPLRLVLRLTDAERGRLTAVLRRECA